MSFEKTATRVWKKLSPQERLAAAASFFKEPSQEVLGAALAAIIRVRHVRPQVARTLPGEEQARVLASVLEPGEPVAAALLVALHLGGRRRMLTMLLDSLGLPHEDGILKDETGTTPPTDEAALQAVRALIAAYPRREVETYLNTLWLQDSDRWGVLEKVMESVQPQ